MTANNGAHVLVRGADGRLYAIDQNGCQLVSEGEISSRGTGEVRRPTETTTANTDHGAGRVLIEADDYEAGRVLIDADDHGAGRVLIEAGDHGTGRSQIEARH